MTARDGGAATIADAILAMTFGELVDMANDLRDSTGVQWRTYGDEDFTPLDLASALHAWAEGNIATRTEGGADNG